MENSHGPAGPGSASLVVVDPHGHRARVPVEPVPFHIGRQPDNQLVIRDSRVSRSHARIVRDEGCYWIEDSGSRHGTWVNGKKISRQALSNSDRIEFGTQESYQLIFALDGAEMKRLMEQVAASESPAPGPGGGNMARLRAILDLARTLQSSFSIDDVLTSVVDTALAITGAERGFLLLRRGESLDTRVARHRHGHHLKDDDLRVPREVIHRALQHRRELLYMNFDPLGADDTRPQNSVADLELRSVVCVPLVRIRTGLGDSTSMLSAASETVGVLYMDSRVHTADLAGGNRELLQAVAIEASTVLENARLLEEERTKRQMEQELRLARSIQQSLLPRALPSEGWLCAAGSSVASHEVGGDYFDVIEISDTRWSVVVSDVSGKGVASALLASLLQGALATGGEDPDGLARQIGRLNGFLYGRTGGEKYATVLYAVIDRDGRFSYVNAAHCPPMVLSCTGEIAALETTGMPVGLIDPAEFAVARYRLSSGDKVVIYTDGVTEAQNPAGEFFGRKRLRAVLAGHAREGCSAVHEAVHDAVAAFTEGAAQSDDITVLVLEYRGN